MSTTISLLGGSDRVYTFIDLRLGLFEYAKSSGDFLIGRFTNVPSEMLHETQVCAISVKRPCDYREAHPFCTKVASKKQCLSRVLSA